MSHHDEWLSALTDRHIVDLYSMWSEDFYCASFLILTADDELTEFIGWLLDGKATPVFENYELELIRKFRQRIAEP